MLVSSFMGEFFAEARPMHGHFEGHVAGMALSIHRRMAAHSAFGQTDAAKVLALFQAAGDDELLGGTGVLAAVGDAVAAPCPGLTTKSLAIRSMSWLSSNACAARFVPGCASV
jgi:hypothetical protein